MADILLDLGIDLNSINDDLKRVAANIRQEFEKVKPKIGVDGKAAQSDVNALVTSYQKLGKEANLTTNQMRQALAQMVLSGQKGTKEFDSMVLELKEAKTQADLLDKALESVDNEISDIGKNQGLEKGTKKPTLAGGIKEAAGGLNLGGFALAGGVAGGVTAGVQILQEGVTKIIDLGKQYETGMAEFSAITGVSGAALDSFGEKARNLAKQFGGDVTNQIETFKGILSRLGPDIAKSPEALEKMTIAVNTLAKASGLEAPEAMDAMTSAALQFGIDLSDPIKAAQEMTNMVNIMAAGAKEGAAEIPQIKDALVVAGAAAKASGVSFLELNAGIQVMAQGGKYGAEAGTALRNVMIKLQEQSKEAEGSLNKVGIKGKDLAIALQEKGLGGALGVINKAFEGTNDQIAKNQVLIDLFGSENLAAGATLVTNAKNLETFTQKLAGTNTAFEQAKINMDTLAEKSARMTAQFNDIFLGIYQAVAPPIISALEVIGSAIKGTFEIVKPFFEEFFNGIVEGFEPLGAAFTKLWDSLQELFKLFGDGTSQANLLKDAFKFLGDIIGWLIETNIKIFTFLLTQIINLWSNIIYTIGNVIKWFQELGREFQKFINSGGFVANVVKGIYDSFVLLVDSIIGTTKAVLEFLGILDKESPKAPLKKKTAEIKEVGETAKDVKKDVTELNTEIGKDAKKGSLTPYKNELEKAKEALDKLIKTYGNLAVEDKRTAAQEKTFKELPDKIDTAKQKVDELQKKFDDAMALLKKPVRLDIEFSSGTLATGTITDQIRTELQAEFNTQLSKLRIDLIKAEIVGDTELADKIRKDIEAVQLKLNITEIGKEPPKINPLVFSGLKRETEESITDGIETALAGLDIASIGASLDFTKLFPTEEVKEQTKEIEDSYTKTTQDLRAKLSAQALSYDQYRDGVRDANKQLEESMSEAADASKNAWLGVAAVLGGVYQELTKQAEIAAKKYKEVQADLQATDKQKAEATMQLVGATTAAALVQIGQVLAEGEATVGDVISLVLDAAANLLTSMIPVWVAGIFSTSVSQLGIAGVAVAAGLTAAMYGLVAVAKNALTSGAEEGHVAGGQFGKRGVSDDTLIWVNKNEDIFKQSISMRERPLFDYLHSGGTSLEFFNKHYGTNTVMVNNQGVEAKLDRLNTTLERTKLVESHQNLGIVVEDNRAVKVETRKWKGR